MPTGVEIKGPCKILLSSLLWWPIQILYNLKTSDRSPKIVAYMNSLCNSTSYTMLQWLYIIDLNNSYLRFVSIFLWGYPCSNSKFSYADMLRRNCTGALLILPRPSGGSFLVSVWSLNKSSSGQSEKPTAPAFVLWFLVLVIVLALFFVLGVGSEGPIIRSSHNCVLSSLRRIRLLHSGHFCTMVRCSKQTKLN